MKIHLLAACALLIPAAASAQEDAGPAVFKLNLAVHEMEDARRLSTKNYTLTLENGGKGVIRLGTKVPIPSGGGSFQYMDVGFNLDCRLHQRGPQMLALHTDLEISNADAADTKVGGVPAVRQVRTSAGSLIAPGKPTTIITADDLTSKKRYEIEVTATQMK